MQKSIITFCVLFLLTPSLHAQIITIGPTGDYPNLEASENFISAGDTLLLQSQVFSDGSQFLENLNGTADAPIVIMAQNQHQSIFQGGTEAIHLINCNHIVIEGLVVEQQNGNGINIDDGGDYTSPSTFITIRDCIFRDMAADGNNDLLKMSGVDSFLIEACQFINGGAGGAGIDFVGCHFGTIQDCFFDDPGVFGIQNKGGTQNIRIQRNTFKNVSQRALNLGGNTGLEFFRPPLPNPIVDAFEAADLEVFSNVFIGCWAPIAYVGCVRVRVYNNTFYQPENWVLRILQETTEPGFLSCSDNEFINNIIYLSEDLTEVNIGPNTSPSSFKFSNNLWYNASNDNWSPTLPVTDFNQVIDQPQFEDTANENFKISSLSPAVGNGLLLEEPSTDFYQLLFNQPPSIGAFEGNNVISQIQIIHENLAIPVFPNPLESSGTIDLQAGSYKDVKLFLIDTNGSIIQWPSKFENEKLHFEKGNLPNGIYFFMARDQRSVIGIGKIVVI